MRITGRLLCAFLWIPWMTAFVGAQTDNAVSREYTLFELPIATSTPADNVVAREGSIFTLPVATPVDADNAVSREGSVYRFDPTPPPNLIVSSVTTAGPACGAPGGLLSGDTLSVTYTVENSGAGPTSGTWKEALFFTDAPTLDVNLGNETLLANVDNVTPLAAGGSSIRTVQVTLPQDIIGCRYIAVYVDARPVGGFTIGQEYDVDETSEVDNAAFSAGYEIELAPQPDLVAQIIPLSLNAGSGQPLTVGYVLQNSGPAATDSGIWSDRVYLSQDTVAGVSGGDVFLGTRTRGGAALAGGAMDATAEVTGTLPLVFDGTWNLKMFADNDQQVSEAAPGGEDNFFVLGTVLVTQIPGADIGAQFELGTDLTWTPGHTATAAWSGTIGSPLVVNVYQSWLDQLRIAVPGGDVVVGSRAQTTLSSSGDIVVDTYTGSQSFVVPTGLPEGTFDLIVEVNQNGGLYEGTNTISNTTTVPVTIAFDPTNLVPEVNFDATPFPSIGAVGALLDLRWRVTNILPREAPVSTWIDEVRFVGPGIDTAISSLTHTGGLAGNSSYIATSIATVPAVPAGSYSLIVRADRSNQVFEQGGEGDNDVIVPFTVTGELSDLTVDPVIGISPPAVQAGEEITVDWTVENNGTAAPNSTQWQDRVYLSNGTFLGERTRSGGLAPGSSYSVSAAFTIPVDQVGTFQVQVVTDPTNQVFESDESNNAATSIATVDVTPLPLPNLEVTSVTSAVTATAGQPFTVNWTVQNSGAGEPLPGSWSDSIYLSTDTALDPGDTYLGALGHSGGLLVSASYGGSLDVTIPLTVAGSLFVIVETDGSNAVEESDETDNDLRTDDLVEVILPDPGDLVVSTVSDPPATGTVGLPATFAWDITNQNTGGTVATVSGQWRDAVFLSTDPTWSVDDLLLGEAIGPSVTLTPDATDGRIGSFNLPVPPLGLGPYHLVVRADSAQQIPEVDEDNNLGSSIGTIDIQATDLLPGALASGAMLSGELRLYRVPALAGGETIEISFDHASLGAWTELFVRSGFLPDDDTFDAVSTTPGSPQQVLRIADVPAGDLFILARTNGTIGDPSFTIQADLLPLQVESATPDRVGDTGRVTIEVLGANFDPGVLLDLTDGLGNDFTPITLTYIDSCRLEAEFEFMGAPNGTYDVAVTNPDMSTATGSGLVTIEPTVPPVLTIEFDEPPTLRAAEFATIEARVRNLGNIDAPYVVISQRTPIVDTRRIEILSTQAEASLAWSDGLVLLSTALERSLPPGVEISLATTYHLEEAAGEFIAQRAAAVLERAEWIQLQEDHAEAIRLALLADPGQIPSEEYVLLQPLLADAGLWRDDWFSRLVAVGLLDPSDLPGTGVPPAPGAGALVCPETTISASVAAALAAFELGATGTAFAASPPDEMLVALEAAVEPLWDAGSCETVEIRSAIDPNEKNGNDGFGFSSWVGLSKELSYAVHFENIVDPVLGAPASRVAVRDPLDIDVDAASVRLGDIDVNGFLVTVPEGRIFYQTTLDLRETQNVFVQLTAGVDAGKREVFWIFQSIDPDTGLPPIDATQGFLPPSEGEGPGSGSVNFDVQPSGNLAGSGPEDIVNGASILFDGNAPIVTNTVTHLVDPTAPSSTLSAVLDPLEDRVDLSWSADDGLDGSGLQDFDLYSRVVPGSGFVGGTGGTLQPILLGTIALSTEFVGDPGVTYEFFLVARDQAGNVETLLVPDATVEIPPDGPLIDTDPSSQTICEGASVVFSVGVSGSPPFTYQWRFEGAPISGATDATLTIDPVILADGGLYDVEVTNSGGSVLSGSALLTVLALPTITLDPQGGAFCPGDSTTLTVIAAGAGPLGYQWLLGGVAIPGAGLASLDLSGLTPADEGSYTVEVSNSCGTTTSAAAAIDIFEPPAITDPPLPQSVCTGGSATFSVVATGDPAPTYQWFLNGSPITGADSSVIVIDPVGSGDVGVYTVEVAQVCGALLSDPATLVELSAPIILSEPTGETLCVDDPLTLTADVVADPAATLQWLRNGAAIPGADALTYSVAAVTPTDEGTYELVASNLCGSAATSPVFVEVQEPPVVTTPPMDVSVCLGDPIILTVAATGEPSPTYSWTLGGVAIPGETAATLTIPAATPGDAGEYCVTVLNPCGSITVCATISVGLPPSILSAPDPVSTCEGTVAIFSVVADGTGPFTYQWDRDGSPLAGEVGDTLQIDLVTPADAGNYTVMVAGACGVVASDPAELTVLDITASECDCNGNGILDSVDITNGTSADLNGDGIPDECQTPFIRGDSNTDGGYDIGDAIATLSYLFSQGPGPCLVSLDSNDDGAIDIGDAIFTLAALFSNGPLPSEPHPGCELDPTPDGLVCEIYDSCP